MDERPAEQPSLQFDKAELTQEANTARCAACASDLADIYFDVNGKPLCGACKGAVEQSLTRGAGFPGLVRAGLLGTGAAALGSLLWYAIRTLTGYEIGLISIVIGIFVGQAVRRGCGGRGGWAYQALAVFLTYSSIALTYLPEVTKAIPDTPPQAAATPAAPSAPSTATASPSPEPGPQPSGAQAPTNSELSKGRDAAPMGPGEAIVGLAVFAAVVLGICYAAPFLGGFDNIIGLLIIAFGLYEAWRINKRPVLVINGPLHLHPADVQGPPENASHG